MLLISPSRREQLRLHRTRKQATCWKIVQMVPTGAKTFRFTDWPEVLELAETGIPGVTETYTPVGVFNASARRRSADDGLNFEGHGSVLISDLLTHEELSSRRFDNAEVSEFLVFVDTAWHSVISFRDVYLIESVVYDGSVYRAACRGLIGLIGEASGELLGPLCRVEVFSQGPYQCNANPASFTFDAAIGIIYDDRLSFQSDDLSSPDGSLNDGKLLWTTGKNIGIYSEVKTNVEVLPAGFQDITLHTKTPLSLTIGDEFTVQWGCNKLAGVGPSANTGHCKHRYNNLINFQGEPTMPGRDAVIRGARLV